MGGSSGKPRPRRTLRHLKMLNSKTFSFSCAAGRIGSGISARGKSSVPASVPMKTSDGRFGYEAAGEPAFQPLVFLHGIGGAARAWRGQIEAFSDRYRAMAWDIAGLWRIGAASHREHCHARGRPAGLPASGWRGKPILVGHSVGGMIVQQWLTKTSRYRRCGGARTDQPGLRQGRRRPGRRNSSAHGSARSIAAKPWLHWPQPW